MKSKYPYVSFRTDSARKTTYDATGNKVESDNQRDDFIFELANATGTTCHVRADSIMNIREGSKARITGYGNFPDRSDYNELAAFIERQFRFELEAARKEEAEEAAALIAAEEEKKKDELKRQRRSKKDSTGEDSGELSRTSPEAG